MAEDNMEVDLESSGILLLIVPFFAPAVIMVVLIFGPCIDPRLGTIRLRHLRPRVWLQWWGFWYLELYARELWRRASVALNALFRGSRPSPFEDLENNYDADDEDGDDEDEDDDDEDDDGGGDDEDDEDDEDDGNHQSVVNSVHHNPNHHVIRRAAHQRVPHRRTRRTRRLAALRNYNYNTFLESIPELSEGSAKY
ncbi:hypothetical protein CHU98_g5388 [Xylaria longipes]|nr:hypothetical protein CHU98_g5388 [Xylaria longipes]